MSTWTCSIRPTAMEDARAALGPLAEETWEVQADSAAEALTRVSAQIEERRPMTTLPPDLLDDWLELRESG